MSIFVTANGFIKKTLPELKTFYENEYKARFGNDIDLDSEGPFGQLVGLFSKRDADIWDGAEEIYNSRNPNAATGISLDNIAAESGVIRQSEGKTQVFDVLLYGTDGTTVVAGKKARQAGSEIDYILLANAVISLSTARQIVVTVGSPANLQVFTITLNGTGYSDTATVPPDTADDIAENLKLAIEAGAFTGTVVRDADELTITNSSEDFTVALTANITLDLIAGGGDFEADESGPNPVPADTLTEIVTPVAGWDSVTNPSAGVTGRNQETDEELRIRRALTLVSGNATEDAIVNAILNNVVGITTIAILSNRTDVTDVDGLPPHSFEVVVAGGIASDIAQNIWDTQPAGIATYGSETEVVVDSQGNNQTIYFSRPVAEYIFVKVRRKLYSEETYPTDGDNQIKQAIVDWSLTNQPVGKDVIRQRLSIPVYTIPGIGEIEITLDSSPTKPYSPSYASVDIAIAIRQYASFDIADIVVEVLP